MGVSTTVFRSSKINNKENKLPNNKIIINHVQKEITPYRVSKKSEIFDISVVIPCRNEQKTIDKCIRQIKDVFKSKKINGQIIVSDSSSDNSKSIIKKHKDVILVNHTDVGYGIAILNGIKKATGKILIIGDADGTYDFKQIPLLIKKINQGYDFVLGSRLKGEIKKGAMPWLHRYIGNPILSGLLNLFFSTNINDAHSGFRAIKADRFNELNLKTTGMEFASEMIIKAAKLHLKISEVPITYSKRLGESKLNSFNDGWRHLRFMLLFSPTYIFVIPGLIFMILGLFIHISHLLKIISFTPQLLLGSFLIILGYQVINLGLYSRIYATHSGYETHDEFINLISKRISLESGLFIGLIILLYSLMLIVLNAPQIIIFTILVVGFQTLFSAFFISMMVVDKNE
jgi:glycosyltransferase involved in cell wall biosynthesis